MNGPPDRSRAPRQTLLADGCLLMAAILWGSGFVAQRAISEHVGPLVFNAARNVIALAALSLFVVWNRRAPTSGGRPGLTLALAAAAATGGPLFLGGWAQQAGIAQTTASNAGFITGLYVVLVPILAALAGSRLPASTWPAAFLATTGMYLLSATAEWTLGRGDLLVLVSAGFWAIHVHAVGYFARRMDGRWLTWLQILFAAAFSVPLAWGVEPVSTTALRAAAAPLLYSGVVCGAFAFSLQIAGQRNAPPSHAAILMSSEAVFAAAFGWLLLHEHLGGRGMVGAALMLAGMLASQWPNLLGRPVTPPSQAA